MKITGSVVHAVIRSAYKLAQNLFFYDFFIGEQSIKSLLL